MPRVTPLMPPGATRDLEKRILLLIVNLQFSKLSENGIGDLDVHLHFPIQLSGHQRSECLPKLASSYSGNNSKKQKSGIWRSVRRV